MQSRDAKAHFSEVIESASKGEPTTITRHGVPVAMVVPIEKGLEAFPPKSGKTLVELLMEFPGGIDFEELRDHRPPREIEW